VTTKIEALVTATPFMLFTTPIRSSPVFVLLGGGLHSMGDARGLEAAGFDGREGASKLRATMTRMAAHAGQTQEFPCRLSFTGEEYHQSQFAETENSARNYP
jgi:hypothetical protein